MPKRIRRPSKRRLIGCGGRGNGAAENHREAVQYLNEKLGWKLEVQFVATGDWFPGKAKGAGDRLGVPADKCFGGADCYKKVLETNPDIVLLATPPAFRPLHLEAAIQAGKHVFFEKPVAVDPPGIRRVIKAGEEAKQKGPRARRRHPAAAHQGTTSGPAKSRTAPTAGSSADAWPGTWARSSPIRPSIPRAPTNSAGPGWTIWLEMSGDHICEQHVHNLDIANWFLGSHPAQRRRLRLPHPPRGGQHVRLLQRRPRISQWRPHPQHVPADDRLLGVDRRGLHLRNGKPANFKLAGKDPYEEAGYDGDAYVSEHMHLLYAVVKGRKLNEARNVAESTGAAIMARESAYTGKRITWEQMFEDKTGKFYNYHLSPTAEDFETNQVTLLKDGDIRIPVA